MLAADVLPLITFDTRDGAILGVQGVASVHGQAGDGDRGVAAELLLRFGPGARATVLLAEQDFAGLAALCRLHATVCTFARAEHAGLVNADEWPAYRDRFYGDPDGLRAALSFDH